MAARDEAPVGVTARGRGALVVFEGIDRCGKTTQCAKLVEHLQAAGVRGSDVASGLGGHAAMPSRLR